jgi:DNA-binding PadR family transcriptional regulator
MLRPIEFQILLALAGEDRHGYGIMQAVAEQTGGASQLEAGTLYRALHRMLQDGWIAERDRRPAAGRARVAQPSTSARVDDERRRYYRLTPLGRRLASEEAERLAGLVAAARAHRLLRRA